MAIDPAKMDGQRPVAVDDRLSVESTCRLVEARCQHRLDLRNDVARLLDADAGGQGAGHDGALP